MNERQYDLIYNEGSEGYNPYRAKRKKREIEEAIEWGKTREGSKERIHRDLERKDCSIARECGTWNQAEIDDLRAQLRGIEAEEDAEILTAWPLEITKERRVSWNDRVKAGIITPKNMTKAQATQGWTFSNLKKAVKLHNL